MFTIRERMENMQFFACFPARGKARRIACLPECFSVVLLNAMGKEVTFKRFIACFPKFLLNKWQEKFRECLSHAAFPKLGY